MIICIRCKSVMKRIVGIGPFGRTVKLVCRCGTPASPPACQTQVDIQRKAV